MHFPLGCTTLTLWLCPTKRTCAKCPPWWGRTFCHAGASSMTPQQESC